MNSSQLKVLALILMVIEHSSSILAKIFNLPHLNYTLHYGGRLVFPIFVFVMVDAFFKTSNRANYIKRLFLWAIIMSIGSFIVAYSLGWISVDELLQFPINMFTILAPLGKNIFWSLAIGLLILYRIEKIKDLSRFQKIVNYGLILLLAFFSLFTEASIHVVPLFLIFYLCYQRPVYFSIAYVLWSFIFLIDAIWGNCGENCYKIDFFWTNYQWMMIVALPFFWVYNGKRGEANLRYLFYIAYPLHIWVFAIINSLLD